MTARRKPAAVRRVLVIDGNDAGTRARQIAAGGTDSGEAYAAVLESLGAQLGTALACDIVRPADAAPVLPQARSLGDYHGAAITGSALNVYQDSPGVQRQLELAHAVFAAAVPFFGSCWGLQVAAVAAGGQVVPNPLGREFGVARRIELNAQGVAHPLFRGRSRVYEALTVHRDCVAVLPPDSTELARNDMGLQAAEIRVGRGVFWGVQYHPEYTFREIAATARRYGEGLRAEGLFDTPADLERFTSELEALEREPAQRALAWRLGLGRDIMDATLRRAELRNWLANQVLAPDGRG